MGSKIKLVGNRSMVGGRDGSSSWCSGAVLGRGKGKEVFLIIFF